MIFDYGYDGYEEDDTGKHCVDGTSLLFSQSMCLSSWSVNS